MLFFLQSGVERCCRIDSSTCLTKLRFTSFVFFVGFLLLEQVEVIVVGSDQFLIHIISLQAIPEETILTVLRHKIVASKTTEVHIHALQEIEPLLNAQQISTSKQSYLLKLEALLKEVRLAVGKGVFSDSSDSL